MLPKRADSQPFETEYVLWKIRSNPTRSRMASMALLQMVSGSFDDSGDGELESDEKYFQVSPFRPIKNFGGY